ncbi:MAG: hypothetical protein EA390_04990, partial [Balneolaceae bacterium]
MNNSKSLFSKISITAFALIFAAGCASVTDAGIDSQDEIEPTVISIERANDTWDSRNGEDMGT